MEQVTIEQAEMTTTPSAPHGMVKVGMDTDSPGNVGHFIFDYQTLSLLQPEHCMENPIF